MRLQALYEKDFYSWINTNVHFLKEHELEAVDVKHLIEELEGMAKKQKQELFNRFVVLLSHILKWEYQPQLKSRSWALTIMEQQRRITRLLEDSPSLKHTIHKDFGDAYKQAMEFMSTETGISEEKLPTECSYSLEEVLETPYRYEA